MAKIKDLYIATSMQDLNQKCMFDFDKGKSIKTYLVMVNKTYQAADAAFSNNDEERAYILYMRYVDAMMKVRKTKEFRDQSDHYSTLFGTAKLTTALERAEKLSSTLKKRYKKLEESKTAQNELENTVFKKEVESTDAKKFDFKLAEDSNAAPSYLFPTDTVTSQQLYKLLYKDNKKLIVMDIRSVDDYQESHLTHTSSINVPQSTITPGSVTSKIQKGIPLDHIKTWNSRNSVDLVVILDWHSTFNRLKDKSDPLRSLKDSIYKWEQEKELVREPVILEGGYTDWLETFPQFTTNPHVAPPDNKPKTSNVNSLLDFNYSDLRKNFVSTKDEELSSSNHGQHSLVNGVGNAVKANSVKGDAIPEKNSAVPSNSTRVNAEAKSSIPPMYPSINGNTAVTATSTKMPTDSVKPKPVNKPTPTFDRSVKPKPQVKTAEGSLLPTSTVSNNAHMETPTSTVEVAENSSPKLLPSIVDRSKKPQVLSENRDSETQFVLEDNAATQVASSKVNEINELERSILQMKLEKQEREKRLLEIEEKKRLQLLSIKEKMKLEEKELSEREIKAKNELAAAMRQNKPSSSAAAPTVPSSIVNKSNVASDAAGSKTSLTQKPESPVVSKGVSKEASASLIVEPKTMETPIKPPAENPKKIDDIKPFATKSEELSNAKVPIVNKSSRSLEEQSSAKLYDPMTVKKQPKSTNALPTAQANARKSSQNIGDLPASQSAHSPSTQSASSNSTVYKAPLKDEPGNQSVGLKRSFSSPNIAKMVQEDSAKETPLIPSRQSKPSDVPATKPIPSRDFKPVQQDEQDPVLKALNFSLRGVYGGDGPARCGLRNLGNSCYMNSVLQCMFNTTHLADFILSNKYRKHINQKNILGYNGRVAESFAVLVRAVWSGQYKYLVPSDIKTIAGGINGNFAGYSQEDSHEFLLFLLDGLHEDLNEITKFKYEEEPDNDRLNDEDAARKAWDYHKKRNESIIIELFTGQYKATLTCLHCRKSSRKFDAFRFLTLSLPSHSSNITDLIRDFSKQEKLTGDDRWKCPNCKVAREALRTIAIWKLPPVLIIHLKRFVYSGRWRDKIHTNVSFPTSGLDLNNFTCGPIRRNKYDLYAVSHHHGAGLDSGHYTASCRSVDNRWYKYDDTEVSPSHPPHGSSAFILFYSCYPRKMPQATL